MTPHSAAATGDLYPGRCRPRPPAWKDNRSGHAGRAVRRTSSEVTRTGTPSTWPCWTPPPADVRAHLAAAADGAGYAADAGLGQRARARPTGVGAGGHRELRRRAGARSLPRPARTSSRSARVKRAARREERPDRRGARRPRGAVPRAPGQPAGSAACGRRCASVLTTRHAVLVSRTKAINELKSADRDRPRAPARRPAWPLAGPPARPHRATATPSPRSVEHRMTVLDAAVDRRAHPLPHRADRELDPELTRAGPGTSRRTGAAGRARRRARSSPPSSSSAGHTLDGSATRPPSPPSPDSPLEASSGQRARHRLNRGGDRDLNRALHTVAMTRMRCHPETRAYTAKRTATVKHTARSGAASNARSPDVSTDACKPTPARTHRRRT